MLPHEAALRAWLHAQFPVLTDIDDLVQETYVRILQVQDRAAIRTPKAFLFATARNLALDHTRRRKVVMFETINGSPETSLCDDRCSAADTAAHRQELELLTRAIQRLPEGCRQVLTLRKIYGLSQREIAARLGISEHTVEAQVGNGVRRCATIFGAIRVAVKAGQKCRLEHLAITIENFPNNGRLDPARLRPWCGRNHSIPPSGRFPSRGATRTRMFLRALTPGAPLPAELRRCLPVVTRLPWS